MNSKILLAIFIFMSSLALAQMRPAILELRNGEILNGFAKRKSQTIKFKTERKAKAVEIRFASIKSVRIDNLWEQSNTYHIFQTKDNVNFIVVEQLIVNAKISLYERSQRFTHNNGNGERLSIGDSDINLPATQFPKNYYVKKPNEDKLTKLGRYNPLFSDELKQNVLKYFSDCKNLTDKIQSKEFRFRDGIEEMVNYYNENCGLN